MYSLDGKKQTHIADLLFTLALFGVFTLSAVAVLLFGADVYQNTVQKMDENYNQRTCLAYVANQVRQHDASGKVFAGEISGEPALILEDAEGDGRYFTAIYWHQGSLRELYTSKDSGLTASDGIELLPLEAFSVEQNGNLLHIAAVSLQGESMELSLCLRSQEREENQ